MDRLPTISPPVDYDTRPNLYASLAENSASNDRAVGINYLLGGVVAALIALLLVVIL